MKKIFVFFTILLMAVEVRAADLLDAYQHALCSDPIYQQAIAQHFSDKENVPISLSRLLPQAGINVSEFWVKSRSSGVISLVGGQSYRGYDAFLDIKQTIFDFGKFAAVDNAYSISKEADANVNAAIQALIIRVANAYFAVLRDEDNLVYIKSTKAAFAKQLDQVTEQYKVGLKTVTDKYTAEASYDSAVANMIAAETQLKDDRENLRVITGVYYAHLSPLNDSFPFVRPRPANMEAWVATSLRQNWSIKSARYAANAARAVIKEQFAGHLPTLEAEGSYDLNFERIMSSSSPFFPTGASKTRTATLKLNLAVPLFAGGGVIAKTHQAQYNYAVACQNLEQQIRTVVNSTRQSYLGVIAGISKINADKKAIQSATSALDGMQEGYRVGTQTLVDVLNEQQVVYQAQTQYAADRYAYVNNVLALKQAAGTLSQNDLAAINAWLGSCHK